MENIATQRQFLLCQKCKDSKFYEGLVFMEFPDPGIRCNRCGNPSDDMTSVLAEVKHVGTWDCGELMTKSGWYHSYHLSGDVVAKAGEKSLFSSG